MRIEKNGLPILSVDDWRRLAPPKSDEHWVEGRSAFELAKAWCHTGAPAMPWAVRDLLDSRFETRGLEVDCVLPEHRIRFDDHGGEPRNADLAFIARGDHATVAVTIEAKADEPFGTTIDEACAAALERAVENPRSRGVARIVDLTRALLSPRARGKAAVSQLRYQLLTAVAGSLAYATQQKAAYAVLIVHEFRTAKTRDEYHARNDLDFRAFIDRLGSPNPASPLLGPFVVPGKPLFEAPPPLLIGKFVTDCRVEAQ